MQPALGATYGANDDPSVRYVVTNVITATPDDDQSGGRSFLIEIVDAELSGDMNAVGQVLNPDAWAEFLMSYSPIEAR